MPIRRSIKIAEIEIPTGYFDMTIEEKHDVCVFLFSKMIDTLNITTKVEIDRFELLNKILESSIITNVEDEKYEIAAVLKDIQSLLDA